MFSRRSFCVIPHLFILFTVSGSLAQSLIVLRPESTEAEFTVPIQIPKKAKIQVLPLVTSDGKPFTPQPAISEPQVGPEGTHLKMTGIFFWGGAKLQMQMQSGAVPSWSMQRGPEIWDRPVAMRLGQSAQIWFYNFATQPVTFRWRLFSGNDSICGTDAGKPRRNCAGPETWEEATVGAVRSDAVLVTAPQDWFEVWSGGKRQCELEMLFGSTRNAPLRRIPVTLTLDAGGWGIAARWLPAWIFSAWSTFSDLLWVTFWIMLGAVLLMLAQVMIPNFRKCLQLEGQIDSLGDRLQAVSSRIGPRLYSRCHQEIERAKVGLMMTQASSRPRATLHRLALSSNTSEVDRLTGLIPRIESRMRLTESLDECQSAATDYESGLPPSVKWDRDRQIFNIRETVWQQIISDTEEKAASARLVTLLDPAGWLKEFPARLKQHIADLQRQFGVEPWKSQYPPLVMSLPGCTELLAGAATPAGDTAWSVDELVAWDAVAVRLDTVYQMIALKPVLDANPAVKSQILVKLRSTDAFMLADAEADLMEMAQGATGNEVKLALVSGMWDTNSEPVFVTDQDVIRVSLKLREERLNRCTARNRFQCFWHITVTGRPDGAADLDYYEPGWEAQISPELGNFKVKPRVYEADGSELEIQPISSPAKEKGVLDMEIGPPAARTLQARALRGALDASITAVVPVVTVALTHLDKGSMLGIDKLVLLGFTSQAIRAVVVPEPVSPSAPR